MTQVPVVCTYFVSCFNNLRINAGIDHFSKGLYSFGHEPLGEDRQDVDEPEGLKYFPLVKMSKLLYKPVDDVSKKVFKKQKSMCFDLLVN